MPKELILILGGARSGKSALAQKLAQDLGGTDVLFVATAEAGDDDMQARIQAHQRDRPAGWRTLEAPLAVGPAVADVAGPGVVLVDCLTLLASNAVLALGDAATSAAAESAVVAEVDALLHAYREGHATWIIVSSEVGLGLVPPYRLGRIYRDALGRANARLAAQADRVLFMVAGLPLPLK